MTEGLAASAVSRFLAFFPRLKAQPIEATPQALRASSTRKGMATHTQLKLRFAAHLAGEPLRAHLQRDGYTHAPSRGAFKSSSCYCQVVPTVEGSEPKASPARGGGTAEP